jgi:hypothetical protein
MTDTTLVPLDQAPMTWKTLVAISNTNFVPKGLRGKPDEMLAAVFTGRELGVGPMASIRGIDMIDGTASLAGELCAALIWRAGHRLLRTAVSDDAVTMKGQRVVDGQVVAEQEATWTKKDAEAAGLVGKSNWKHYGRAMLQWRATTELFRFFFADLGAGLRVAYTPEELGDEEWTPADTEPIPLEVVEVDPSPGSDHSTTDGSQVTGPDGQEREWLALVEAGPPVPSASMEKHRAWLDRVYKLAPFPVDYEADWVEWKGESGLDDDELVKKAGTVAFGQHVCALMRWRHEQEQGDASGAV